MANVVQIDYLYRDQGKLTEFIQNIAFTDVAVEWDTLKCQIKIIWTWGQESQVNELLTLIREQFKEPIITIENEEYSNVPTLSNESAAVEVREEEQAVAEVEEVVQGTCEVEEEHPEGICAEEVRIPPVEEEIMHVEEEPIPERQPVAEEATVVETEQTEAEVVEIPMPSKEDYENALKELLGEELAEYDFISNPEASAVKFCTDHKIKSEVMRYALALATKVPSEAMLLQGLARLLNDNNRARVKVTLSVNFKKWLRTSYPSFVEEYPEVNVFHFLNIFRNENRKF